MKPLTYLRNRLTSNESNSLLSVVHSLLLLFKIRQSLVASKVRQLLMSVELKELINNYGIVDLHKEQCFQKVQ